MAFLAFFFFFFFFFFPHFSQQNDGNSTWTRVRVDHEVRKLNGTTVVSRTGSVSPNGFGRRGSVGLFEEELEMGSQHGYLSIESSDSSLAEKLNVDMAVEDVLQVLIGFDVSKRTLDMIADQKISGDILLSFTEQDLSDLCGDCFADRVRIRRACSGTAPFAVGSLPLAPQVQHRETLDDAFMLQCMVAGRNKKSEKLENKQTKRSRARADALFNIPEHAAVRMLLVS